MKVQTGDRVVWSYRPRGGYGYVVPVAGVVDQVLGSRVQIFVARKVSGQWQRELRTVAARNLQPRTAHVIEVDGETQHG